VEDCSFEGPAVRNRAAGNADGLKSCQWSV
jgi:hypothetical protein